MSKKYRMKLKTFLISIIFLLLTTTAFAKEWDSISYYKFYTSDGRQNEKDVFVWNVEPYLYIKHRQFDGDLEEKLKIKTKLHSPGNAHTYNSGNDDVTGNVMFMPLSEWFNKKSYQDIISKGGAGIWTLEAASVSHGHHGDNKALYKSKTTFTVSPEPISSGLFILGAATMALGAYRKKITRNLLKKEAKC